MIIIFIKFINQSNDGLNQDFFPIIEFNIPLNLQKYISLFSLLKINVKIILLKKEDTNLGKIIINAKKNPLCFL
tara:strand:- start:57 stop:278 length:222 start_codon:yes stop_codon:yes gene_type:complete